MITAKNCKYCNKEFLAGRKANVFCSHKCYSKWLKGRPSPCKGKKQPQWVKDKLAKAHDHERILITKQDLDRLYWKEMKSFSEIAKEYNASIGWVEKWMKKFNLNRRPAVSPSGIKNGRYKGGYRSREGYIHLLLPDHHLVKGTGRRYVPEHVIVMEQKLGRPLKREEVVHHKNGIKNDNSPSNLELTANNSDHIYIESKLKQFAKQLLYGDIKTDNREELINLFEKFPFTMRTK